MRDGECELVVVGAGPAGLATAIHAARAGLRVIVIDRRRPPLDAACGEGILGGGVEALSRLGVDPAGLGMPFPGIRFVDGEAAVTGPFPPAWPGLAVRRTRLSAALVEQAERAGADLRFGVACEAAAEWGVRTTKGPIRAGWSVAADGRGSPLRRQAGLEGAAPRRPRVGVRRHFRLRPWTEAVEVHWGSGDEAYVTPVGEEEVGVALLGPPGLGGFGRRLARFPELAARLERAEPASRARGAGPFGHRARTAVAGRLLLVGDAIGSLDGITGEGVGLALVEAEQLVRALLAGDPAGYARAVAAGRRRARIDELLLLALGRRRGVRRVLMRRLQRWPAPFERLLAVHVGARPTWRAGAGALLALAAPRER